MAKATPAPATGPNPGPTSGPTPPPPVERRFSLRRWTPVLLARAAHPRLTLLTAVGMGVAASLSGREVRESVLVLVTVLVGQAVLGWTNDVVDRKRDTEHVRAKPIAEGNLDAGTAAFAASVGVLVVVPLAIAAGVWAGLSYLAALLVGLIGTVVLRKGWLSWLPWAVSYALLPAYLAYGGWNGDGQDTPPTIGVTVLAAALGVCVHFLTSLPGLVTDNEDGWRSLPLRVALKTGAARLLWLSIAVTVLVLAGLAVVGTQSGLRQ